MKLFREEALQAKGAQFLGTIRIGRPPSFTLFAATSLVLAAALVAFATWGQITRKARIAGLLVPRLGSLQVTASNPGVLLERRVAEGELVQAGQVMFVLATDRATTQGDIAGLVRQRLEQRRVALESERALRELQARQRQQALTDRVRSTEAELRQLESEIERARHRVALSRKSAERYEQLAGEGFVSDVQSQQKQEELLDLQTRLQTAERTRLVLARDLQSLAADLVATTTQLRTDLAQLDRSLAGLGQEDVENDARRQIVITAPLTGIVTALSLTPGAAVLAGQAVAALVPNSANGQASELEGHLFAPSRTAGFVEAGQIVLLRYAAYPYQKFGMAKGEVVSVSRTPISANDLPAGQGQALMQAAQSNEPLYRINVRLPSQTIMTYGQAQALKPGMALEADVLQDRRFVWEWVLEPVIAAREKMRALGANPKASKQI
jgi:membrane fusion protein